MTPGVWCADQVDAAAGAGAAAPAGGPLHVDQAAASRVIPTLATVGNGLELKCFKKSNHWCSDLVFRLINLRVTF